jgi:hypothetical protein
MRFRHQQAQVRVPFFVTIACLRAGLSGELGKAPIQFRDTRVVGPVPYLGDEVAILVALFRIQTADWRKSLFSMVEKLLGAVNGGGVAQYAAIADKLSDEILECLGMREVECLLAERRAYGSDGVAPVPLMDGYLALLNCAEGAVPAGALKVVDGQLRDLRSGHTIHRPRLLPGATRAARLAQRLHHARVPPDLGEAREQLVGAGPRGEDAARRVQRQILESPDLTEEQCTSSCGSISRTSSATRCCSPPRAGRARQDGGGATRRGARAGGPALVGKMRTRAADRRAPQSGLDGLRQIEREWKAIVPPVPDDMLRTLDKSRLCAQLALDDAEIGRQLLVLGKTPAPMARDPAALVRTLSSAMLA